MIIYTICTIAGVYLWAHFTVATWFFMLAKLSDMGYGGLQDYKKLASDLGHSVAIPIVVSAFVGLVADVVFNLTYGSVHFREWPRELLFTDRVKRHAKYGNRDGEKWARRLNLIFPGHV